MDLLQLRFVQQGQAPPLSPAYVPDPTELDEHVPIYVLEPEHPKYHVPSDDDMQSMEENSIDYPDEPEDDDKDPKEDDDKDPKEDPSEEHEHEDDDEDPRGRDCFHTTTTTHTSGARNIFQPQTPMSPAPTPAFIYDANQLLDSPHFTTSTSPVYDQAPLVIGAP
ncbi:hypothetical protein Tco_0520914 [Tanacetum coccineum]